jgi:hypothetical protein
MIALKLLAVWVLVTLAFLIWWSGRPKHPEHLGPIGLDNQ